MIRTADEWNKLFFEERMFYVNREVKTAAPTGPLYRRFDKYWCYEDLVYKHLIVSDEPEIYLITSHNLYWKSFGNAQKKKVSHQFDESDIYDIYLKAFPLEAEERDPTD